MQLSTLWTRLFTATVLAACATHCSLADVGDGTTDSAQQNTLAATCTNPEGCGTANGSVHNVSFAPQAALFMGNITATPNDVGNANTLAVADPNAVALPTDPNAVGFPGDANGTVGGGPSVGKIVLDSSANVCGDASAGHDQKDGKRLTFTLPLGQNWAAGVYTVTAVADANALAGDANGVALPTDANSLTPNGGTDPNAVADPNGLTPNGGTDPNAVADPNGLTRPWVGNVAAALSQTDGSCARTDVSPLTGTLEITEASLTHVRGTYTLTSVTGEKLEGEMDAASCPALAQASLTCGN